MDLLDKLRSQHLRFDLRSVRGPGSMTAYHPDLLCPPPPCLSSAALHIAVTRSCRRGSCSSRPEVDRRSYIVLHNCDNRTKQLSAYDANQCNPRQPPAANFRRIQNIPWSAYISLSLFNDYCYSISSFSPSSVLI